MEDYKQKYEQALENIKKIKVANKSNKELVDFIEYKYPELKESEDERIKNEIIAFVEQSIHRGGGTLVPQEQEDKWIAWLEKQGEQKANKIHPIFRVGDYIRNKKTSDKVLIEQLNVKSKAYCYTSYDGSAEIHSDFPFSKQDEWELIGQQIVEQKSDDSPKWKELTWQDINTLEGIINNVHYEFRNGIGEEGFGKEVLERFREIKGDEYMDTCEQKPTDKVEPKWKKGHDGEVSIRK